MYYCIRTSRDLLNAGKKTLNIFSPYRERQGIQRWSCVDTAAVEVGVADIMGVYSGGGEKGHSHKSAQHSITYTSAFSHILFSNLTAIIMCCFETS